MAVLTQDVSRPVRGHTPQKDVVYRLAGYTNQGSGNETEEIYKGSLVIVDISDSTGGYARACPATGSIALTTSDIFCGIAQHAQSVTSSNTADGSKTVRCAQDGVWAFAKASLTLADIGKNIYSTDDAGTLTVTSTDALWVGVLVDLDDTYAWVDISRAAGRLNSAT